MVRGNPRVNEMYKFRNHPNCCEWAVEDDGKSQRCESLVNNDRLKGKLDEKIDTTGSWLGPVTKVSSVPELMLCSIYVTGNLCTGVGGKKKKKMMYVTTKNAGNTTCPVKHVIICLAL